MKTTTLNPNFHPEDYEDDYDYDYGDGDIKDMEIKPNTSVEPKDMIKGKKWSIIFSRRLNRNIFITVI